jgi:amidohydrolase
MRLAAAALTLLALAATPPLAQSGQPDPRVAAAVARLTPRITELRHTLHQNPELGNQEVKTAALVAERLRTLGLEVRTGVAKTGVVGILKGARPGPVVAVRADMDALPVAEDTPYPWKSTARATWQGREVPVSHACGHDVHTAVQLGVATILAGMKAELPGTVMFIFQPAEEGPPQGEDGGARLMMKEGIFRELRPSAVFGLHTKASLEVGKIGFTPGAALSAADIFRATIKGRQSHGAQPHLSVDPVVIASQAILALQTIRSRNVDPMAAGLLSVGIIRGGERWNIIPAEVQLEGTVRTYDTTVQRLFERRMREILDGTTKAGGGSFTLDYERRYPLTFNDTALVARTLPSLRRAAGGASVVQLPPWSASEDFSEFAREIPGFFFMLGSLKPGTTSGDHHTPTFMADDGAIPVGMRAMAIVLLDYLKKG